MNIKYYWDYFEIRVFFWIRDFLGERKDDLIMLVKDNFLDLILKMNYYEIINDENERYSL